MFLTVFYIMWLLNECDCLSWEKGVSLERGVGTLQMIGSFGAYIIPTPTLFSTLRNLQFDLVPLRKGATQGQNHRLPLCSLLSNMAAPHNPLQQPP